MLSLFQQDVLREIWDLIESVSEDVPTYFITCGETLLNQNCVSVQRTFHNYPDKDEIF